MSVLRVFFVLLLFILVLLGLYYTQPTPLFNNGDLKNPGFVADDPDSSLLSLYIITPIITLVLYIVFLSLTSN